MSKGLLITIAAAFATLTVSVGMHTQSAVPTPRQTPVPGRTYVGSGTCRDCHADVYQRWAKTRMANVVTDPKVRPQIVIPDFAKSDPLLTFKLDDVALVYGT